MLTTTAIRRIGLPMVALLILAQMPRICRAHAVLMDSTPKPNSIVKGPELDVKLRFNVRIDAGRSSMHLVAPDGTVSTLTLANQAAPNLLQSRVTGLRPGAYTLRWQVLASDGHISRGAIPFNVS